MPKKVTIELTETQAKIVLVAVEEWFRLRLGQYGDFAHDLAFRDCDGAEEGCKAYNRAIANLKMLEGVLEGMYMLAFPTYRAPKEVGDDINIASDIWSALWHALHKGASWLPPTFQMGKEPLPKINIEEEDDD